MIGAWIGTTRGGSVISQRPNAPRPNDSARRWDCGRFSLPAICTSSKNHAEESGFDRDLIYGARQDPGLVNGSLGRTSRVHDGSDSIRVTEGARGLGLGRALPEGGSATFKSDFVP